MDAHPAEARAAQVFQRPRRSTWRSSAHAKWKRGDPLREVPTSSPFLHRHRFAGSVEQVGRQVPRTRQAGMALAAVHGVHANPALKHFLHSPPLPEAALHLTAELGWLVHPSKLRRIGEHEHQQDTRLHIDHTTGSIPRSRDAKTESCDIRHGFAALTSIRMTRAETVSQHALSSSAHPVVLGWFANGLELQRR
jgi:hypothetical protein